MDIGLWMQGVCKSGLLKIVSKELVKYRLDLVGVEEVSWEQGGTEWAECYILMEEELKIINGGQDFLYIREPYQQLLE